MNFNGFSNKRIPQLASATQLSGGEYLVVYQDSTLKKITISEISTGGGTLQGGLPTGGVTGQYLRKSGNGNYEAEWGTISFTTDQITEGTGNVYWTNSRFDARLASANLNASNLVSGTVPIARLSGITDTQIAASAEIADIKLATISTPGKVANSATTASFSNAGNAIVARDANGAFLATMITLSGTPTNAAHVVTKGYVDALSQGLEVKGSVKVATTAELGGLPGLSGTKTIDGVAVSVGDRVLVKNEGTAAYNGIYVVASGSWTRAADANTPEKLKPGSFVFVERGTVNADSGFVMSEDNPASNGYTFVQFSGAGQITAGTGLTKSGNTLNVVAGDSTITVNADSIQVGTISNANVASNASIAWTKLDKTGSSLLDLTTRSASDLSSGTLPDARFPSVLPAISGENLTNLNATNLSTGVIAPSLLPLASGAIRGSVIVGNNITLSSGTISLSSANITGALGYTPLSTSATTTNISEGTNLYYTQARFDTAFSAKSTTNLSEGTNLYWTNTRFDTRLSTSSLNASNLVSGTVSAALLPLATGSSLGAVIVGTNITNTSGTISLSSANVTGALGFTPLNSSQKGANSGVAELDSVGKVPVSQVPSIALSGLERMFAIGDINSLAGTDIVCDYAVVWTATTITAIDVVAPITAPSGSIVVDIVYRATPGGPLTSLYSTNTKPTLSCNGHASWATFTGVNLPNTTSLAQGSIVGFKIISAPAGCEDLYVTVR